MMGMAVQAEPARAGCGGADAAAGADGVLLLQGPETKKPPCGGQFMGRSGRSGPATGRWSA